MPIRSNAYQRYLWRFLPSMLLYAAIFIMVTWTFRHYQFAGAAAIALAILPALPLLGGIAAVGLYITEEQDEFIRMLFIRSVLWGVGLTLAVCTVVGFLQVFNHVQTFPLYFIYILFWVLTGLAQAVTGVLNRGRDE